MKKNPYIRFFILLCLVLAISYASAFIIKKDKKEKDKKLLINKVLSLHNKISTLLIENIDSSNNKIEHAIKTTLNIYLKKDKNFSFYHVSSLKHGMFIPYIIGQKENSNMIMINLQDLNNHSIETSLFHKANLTIFYKKFYFKNKTKFVFTAFYTPSYLNIYIHIFSVNTVLLIFAFLFLVSYNKKKHKEKSL